MKKRLSKGTRITKLLKCFHDSPDDLIFWAFRYFFGRSSIHTTVFATDLAKAIPHLDWLVVEKIEAELRDAFSQEERWRPTYLFGSVSLRATWETVLRACTQRTRSGSKRRRS